MIRTVQQWLTSPEFDALAKGGTLAAFIEAVQRDAVDGAVLEAGCGHNDCMDSSASRIRALIPPKPKETP